MYKGEKLLKSYMMCKIHSKPEDISNEIPNAGQNFHFLGSVSLFKQYNTHLSS
jgi:hypothetical protein